MSTSILFADENYRDMDFHMLTDKQHMESLNGKKVKIRGFLYDSGKNTWILSAEPHLKTCCVGSKDKATTQIFLEGSFDKKWINQIVEIKGVFHFDPESHDGHFYYLNESSLVQTEKNYLGITLMGMGILGLAGWLGKKYYYASTYM